MATSATAGHEVPTTASGKKNRNKAHCNGSLSPLPSKRLENGNFNRGCDRIQTLAFFQNTAMAGISLFCISISNIVVNRTYCF